MRFDGIAQEAHSDRIAIHWLGASYHKIRWITRTDGLIAQTLRHTTYGIKGAPTSSHVAHRLCCTWYYYLRSVVTNMIIRKLTSHCINNAIERKQSGLWPGVSDESPNAISTNNECFICLSIKNVVIVIKIQCVIRCDFRVSISNILFLTVLRSSTFQRMQDV